MPFLVVGAVLSLVVGKVALLEYLGGKIGAPFGLKAGQRPLAAFFVGIVLITLLYLVPVLGLFTAIVFSVWGFGAAVTAGWIALRRENRAVTPPPHRPCRRRRSATPPAAD